MSKLGIIKLLVERDGITEKEAHNLVEETREQMLNISPFKAADIVMDNLGLEMDYIFDLI